MLVPIGIQHSMSIVLGLRRTKVRRELDSCTGGNMSTRTQMISSIAIAAAFMVASAVMPETADAWWKTGREAPEIDPSTVSSAIALAMGGLAVLSDKIRRR